MTSVYCALKTISKVFESHLCVLDLQLNYKQFEFLDTSLAFPDSPNLIPETTKENKCLIRIEVFFYFG